MEFKGTENTSMAEHFFEVILLSMYKKKSDKRK